MSNLTKQLLARSQFKPGLESIEAKIHSEQDGTTTMLVDAEGAANDQPDEDVDAAAEITAVVEAVGDAQDTVELVEEHDDVKEGIEQLIAAIESFNELGGMTMPTYALAMQAADRYADRLGLDVQLISASTEGFHGDIDQRNTVSVAGLESVLNNLVASGPALAKQSQQQMQDMVAALRKALPGVAQKLQELRGDIELSGKDAVGQIEINQGTLSALTVDGTLPEDLVTYFATYTQLGSLLFKEYSRVAQKSAEKTAGLMGKLNYDTPEGFWSSLAAVVKEIDDPRKLIPVEQLTMSLPGSGPLFGPAEIPEEPARDCFGELTVFVKSHAPIVKADAVDGVKADMGVEDAEVSLPGDVVPTDEAAPVVPSIDPTKSSALDESNDMSEATGVKALNRAQLRTIADSLKSLVCDEAAEKSLESIAASWGSSENALQEAREGIANMTGQVPEALGARTQIVIRYIETVHRLAIWPQANYLANLLYVVNAFADFGVQMLNGKPVDVKETPEEAASTMQEATANVTADESGEVAVSAADETEGDEGVPALVGGAATDAAADAVEVGAQDKLGDPMGDAAEATDKADDDADAAAGDDAAGGADDAGADDAAAGDDAGAGDEPPADDAPPAADAGEGGEGEEGDDENTNDDPVGTVPVEARTPTPIGDEPEDEEAPFGTDDGI